MTSTRKMTTRKMFEELVAKCRETETYGVKLVNVSDGIVNEAKHPIDLLAAMAGQLNLLWEVEIIAAKRTEGYVTVVFKSDIEQENGDPDFQR